MEEEAKGPISLTPSRLVQAVGFFCPHTEESQGIRHTSYSPPYRISVQTYSHILVRFLSRHAGFSHLCFTGIGCGSGQPTEKQVFLRLSARLFVSLPRGNRIRIGRTVKKTVFSAVRRSPFTIFAKMLQFAASSPENEKHFFHHLQICPKEITYNHSHKSSNCIRRGASCAGALKRHLKSDFLLTLP